MVWSMAFHTTVSLPIVKSLKTQRFHSPVQGFAVSKTKLESLWKKKKRGQNFIKSSPKLSLAFCTNTPCIIKYAC